MSHILNPPFSILILLAAIFMGCTNNKTADNIDTVKKTSIADRSSKINAADSIEILKLVKAVYKWHEVDTARYFTFKPLKQHPIDTAYTGIDLADNIKVLQELKQTGLFAKEFLTDYRNIAERMDKELHNGSSLWPEGELSTFGDDADAWCNCQDIPTERYWQIITLTPVKYYGSVAIFKWTWGDNFYYSMKAKKENNEWKIAYMQGFDMAAYSWEWWKENKGK